MKIAFDACPLAERNKTGIGLSMYNLVRSLLTKYPEHEYSFNLLYPWYRSEKPAILNVEIAKLGKYQINTHKSSLPVSILYSSHFPYSSYFNDAVDITHFHDFIIPTGVKGKKVVVIHDMSFKRYPETTPFLIKFSAELNLKNVLKRADMILTDSNFSKEEILQYFDIYSKKITVTPYGVDTEIYHQISDKDSINLIRKKYKIHGDYFLYLGSFAFRKNIARLIRAYSILKEKHKDIPYLILAGADNFQYKETVKMVHEIGLDKSIIFTGYVDGKDVTALICGAQLFVYPSLYEGFGLPVLEAMACGVPVLTSNTSSLAEVAGDAAVLVNPLEVEDIMINIERMYHDENLLRELSAKGINRSRHFTWEHTAEMTMDVYKSLI